MSEPRTAGVAGDRVLVRRDGDALHLTLQHGTANALDLPTAQALTAGLRTAVNEGLALVVLRGGARFFSAGGDLRAMQSAPDPSGYIRRLADTLHEGIVALADSSTVLLAVVEGAVAGAGLGLVLNADVVVCAPSARFTAAYGAAGLTPDTGVSALLPLAIGELRARRMLLLGESIDAATALDWGLASELVAGDRLDARVAELAATLTSSPAANETVRLLRRSRLLDLGAHLEEEARTITAMLPSPDAQRRIGAFLSRSAG